jgi:hypothetical protein
MINRLFRDRHHSREADSAVYNPPNLEAPMTDNINSRAAIQARIAEWQHQTRDSTYQSTDFLFSIAKARWASWFRRP